MLIPNPRGDFRFLEGIAPYSSGVVADPGFELVHVTLRRPLPWRDGFGFIEAYLTERGRPRPALAAVELRSPGVRSFAEFAAFNAEYCDVLGSWGLYVGEHNPIARTNVVPDAEAPEVTSIHAFSYSAPGDGGRSLVVAGAGELRDALLDRDRIVRRGEVSADAMAEKAAYVISVMAARMRGLGADWSDITMIDVYTAHPLAALVRDVVLPASGGHGVHWYVSRPPVAELEFEMDMRGIRRERFV